MQDELDILQAQQAELLRRYAKLRDENALLRQANEHQRAELLRTHEEFVSLQRDYKHLQTAHALCADSPEAAQAKRRLTQLINLVDEAIKNVAE